MGRIQPDRRTASITDKLHVWFLGEGSASQGDNRRFGFRSFGQSCMLDPAKKRLTRPIKNLADRLCLSGFNRGVKINEGPAERLGQQGSDSGFPAARKPQKVD